MLEQIIEWDRRAMVALNLSGQHTHFLDNFFWMVSDILVWAPVMVAFFYVIIKHEKRDSLFVFLAVVLLFLLCDRVSSGLLKPNIARFRPSRDPMVMDLLTYVHEYRGGRFGFPSSHAANSFGFMVLSSLILKNRKYTVCALCWATMCAYSRIYLGVHFPLDILCGTVLGILFGYLCYYLLKKVRQRYSNPPLALRNETNKHSMYEQRDVNLILMVLAIVLFTIICCAIRMS